MKTFFLSFFGACILFAAHGMAFSYKSGAPGDRLSYAIPGCILKYTADDCTGTPTQLVDYCDGNTLHEFDVTDSNAMHFPDACRVNSYYELEEDCNDFCQDMGFTSGTCDTVAATCSSVNVNAGKCSCTGGQSQATIVSMNNDYERNYVCMHECTPFTASLGPLQTASVNIAVSLADDHPDVKFYSNNTCTTQTVYAHIPAGFTTDTVWVKETSQTPNIFYYDSYFRGLISGVPPIMKIYTEKQCIAKKLFGSVYPTEQDTYECKQFVMQLRDASDQAIVMDSDFDLALSSSSSDAKFYSEGSCTSQITQATIHSGYSEVTFYYKSPRPDMTTLSGSDTVYVTDAMGISGFTPWSTMVTIYGVQSLSGAITNTTSAATCETVTVTTVGRSGTIPVTANRTIHLATGSSKGKFYSNNSCTSSLSGDNLTITTGQSQGTAYYRDYSHGSWSITATAPSTSYTQDQDYILVNGATDIVFTSTAANQAKNTCSAHTVQLQGWSSTPYPLGETTVFNLSGGSGTYYSNSNCSTSTTTLTFSSSQTSANFWYKQAAYGSPMLGVAVASGQGWSLNAGAQNQTYYGATNLAFDQSYYYGTSNVTCIPMQVRSQDVYNINIPVTSTTSLSLSSSPSGTFFSDSSCTSSISSINITAGNYQTATFYFMGSMSGGGTLQASGSPDGTSTSGYASLSLSFLKPQAALFSLPPLF